jgi:hypothetical protein
MENKEFELISSIDVIAWKILTSFDEFFKFGTVSIDRQL